MRMKRFLCAIGLAAFLSGCVGGTDFKRPDPSVLTVGKSTSADITRVMGEPYATADGVINHEKVQFFVYGYAAMYGSTRNPAASFPQRTMKFVTFNDVLVGEEYTSSFAADATEFDASKVPGIQTGKSTRADVIALLGQPGGEVRYPLVKNKADRGIVYSYQHNVKHKKINPAVTRTLIVSFDANEVVTDVDFNSYEVR